MNATSISIDVSSKLPPPPPTYAFTDPCSHLPSVKPKYHSAWLSNDLEDSASLLEQGLYARKASVTASTHSTDSASCKHAAEIQPPEALLSRRRSFGIVLAFSLIFLIGPVWAINFIPSWHSQLVLVSVLILLFSTLLSVNTSRICEVLGATAAYVFCHHQCDRILMFCVQICSCITCIPSCEHESEVIWLNLVRLPAKTS